MPLIRARGLRKEHQMAGTTAHALRGISLELRRGDFRRDRGPSGSGKSTLMHLLGLGFPQRRAHPGPRSGM